MDTKLENTAKQTSSPWDPPILSDKWWKLANPNSPENTQIQEPEYRGRRQQW